MSATDKLSSQDLSAPGDLDTEALARAFCAWPLPKSVCADPCATNSRYAFPRFGTSLLTFAEAKSMFDYLVESGFLQPASLMAAERARLNRLLLEMLDWPAHAKDVGVRVGIAIAAKAVLRGRHLTADETLRNLAAGLADGDEKGRTADQWFDTLKQLDTPEASAAAVLRTRKHAKSPTEAR